MEIASVTHWPLLSLLIWLPILGGVFTLMAGNKRPDLARWIALGFAWKKASSNALARRTVTITAPPIASVYSPGNRSRRPMK